MISRLTTASILTLFVSAQLPAQAEATTVSLTPKWKHGSRYRVVMTKEKINLTGGRWASLGKASTEVTLEIKSASKRGYEVWWTYGATTFNRPGVKLPEHMKRMVNINRNIKLKMLCNGEGKPISLYNKKEAVAAYRKSLINMRAWLKETGKPAGWIERVMKPMEIMANQIDTVLLIQPTSLFIATGLELKPGESFRYQDKITTPLFANPIGTMASFKLEAVDKETAQVRWQQALNPKDLKVALDGLINQFKRRGQNPPKDLRFNVKDEAIAVMDLATGMPSRVTMTRTTTAGKRGQRLVHTFTVKPLAAAKKGGEAGKK